MHASVTCPVVLLVSMPPYVLRPLQQWSIDAILAVQEKAYAPFLVEQAHVLQGKLDAGPPGHPLSWGAALADAPDELCGYAIAVPWSSKQVPMWNHTRLVSPQQADCLYVHDIAVAPRHHGSGLANRLMQQVLNQGASCDWPQAALVAVQGADNYWRRFGFAPAPGPDVGSFGPDAVWMMRAYLPVRKP